MNDKVTKGDNLASRYSYLKRRTAGSPNRSRTARSKTASEF